MNWFIGLVVLIIVVGIIWFGFDIVALIAAKKNLGEKKERTKKQ